MHNESRSTPYLGRHLLVGLTYLDGTGEVTKQVQLHGVITKIGEHSISFERADGGGEFSIPFDGTLEAGQPGATYTLRSTGEVVAEVDFVCSWTIHPRPDA